MKKKKENISHLQKISLSPLIATILLIVVAVAIIGMVVSWGKDFTNESLKSTNTITYSKSSLDGFIYPEKIINKTLFFKNTSKKDLIIEGYKIISAEAETGIYSEYIDFNESIIVNPGMSYSIPIICIPAKDFFLDLKLENNTFLKIKYSTTYHNFDECIEYGLIARWDFSEGSGNTVYDKTDNGVNGTISLGTTGNTLVEDFWGNINYAGYFDGLGDNVNFGHTSEILEMGYGERTVFMLFKPDNNPPQDHVLFTTGAGGGGYGYDLELVSDGRFHMEYYSLGTTRQRRFFYVAHLIDYNNWNVVSSQFLRDKFKFFLKSNLGEYTLDVSRTDPLNVLNTSTSCYNRIGTYSCSTGLWNYKGWIGETRIYNRELSDYEAKYIYDSVKDRYS